jgi:septal ring factor EnvC (AmiA/AmiB activator)
VQAVPSHKQPSSRRLDSRRFRRRRAALGGALATVAVVAGVSFAGAADPSLEDRIESAESEVDRLSGKVDAQSADVSELQAEARQAGARAMQLAAEIEQTEAQSRALEDDLAAAQHQLEAVKARYKRALGVLSERLVEIYKVGRPDGLTVILDSDGFDDLETRAEYLDALNDADRKIAERVESLREEVKDSYDEIAGLQARIEEEAARLKESRSEFTAAEADAERRAAELGQVLAGNQEDLNGAEGRLAELEAEQEAAQAPSSGGGDAYLGGPYSIPTYIVMCESGGNYRALNPSSMAGGAYQIIPSTWHAYGGSGYAHQASKAEQDRIAALIWADVGPSAWSCA